MFSCKFAAYFQKTFSYEHLWKEGAILFSRILSEFKRIKTENITDNNFA